ncbi:thioredoxin-like protein [Leucosporidium creatinivorum]|uniref:Thioredoxin-like protein n=1 Tax=Leucosporidium creatinivorum TaxID=106004 RepID=A0A1Y2F164_9BASI|nr:thioredoxin-like protein [Leucosporidium creatinivorum]
MPVTIIKTEDQYKDVIASKGRAVIQYTAPWDQPSKAIKPKFDEFAQKYGAEDAKFYRADISDQQDVAMTSGVKNPIFRFYQDGKQVEEHHFDRYEALERALGKFFGKH